MTVLNLFTATSVDRRIVYTVCMLVTESAHVLLAEHVPREATMHVRGAVVQ